MFTIACCVVIGLELGLDLLAVWLAVMPTYLCVVIVRLPQPTVNRLCGIGPSVVMKSEAGRGA